MKGKTRRDRAAAEPLIVRRDIPVVRIIRDLPDHHRDRFDRMIIEQALHGNYTVIGSDEVFDNYGVKRIW